MKLRNIKALETTEGTEGQKFNPDKEKTITGLCDSLSNLFLLILQVLDSYTCISSRLDLIHSHSFKMCRAKTPCKQLNSEAIRGATLCYMSPVIAGQCSVISAKCVWNVKEKDLHKSWNSICKKRDSCDKAISGSFLKERA